MYLRPQPSINTNAHIHIYYYLNPLLFQRPTAKELLRHKFIVRAKRNNHLMDMIDRYKKWSLTHTNDSDSDSDASDSNNGGVDGNSGQGDDSDWNLTVKGIM